MNVPGASCVLTQAAALRLTSAGLAVGALAVRALTGPALLPRAALFPLWWNTAKPRTSAPTVAVATRTPATR